MEATTEQSAADLEAKLAETPIQEAPVMSQNIETVEQPLVIPEKFKGKGVEDILKSYTHLESEHTKARQQMSELQAKASRAEQLEAALVQQQQLQAMQQASVPVQSTTVSQDDFMQVWERDPAMAVKLRTEQAERKMEYRLNAMETQRHYLDAKSRYPDFAELEPIMVQDAQQILSSGIIPADKMNSPAVIDYLYYAARGRTIDQRMQEAKQQGMKDAQRLHNEKLSAYSEGSTPSQGTIRPEDLTASELEKLIGTVKR